MARKVKVKRSHQTRCGSCGQFVPNYDIVSYGSMEEGYREICRRCLNTKVAEGDGLDKFEHVNFEPVRLIDCTGKAHMFHFRTNLFGPGVALDAFELRDGHPAGYQFQIIGEPEDDLLVLLGRLIEKMRRALAIRHVTNGEYGLRIADRQVRGMIDWDADYEGESIPLLIVDGREITWEQFGRMLMTFEGSHFKLEIRDKSEEV